MKPILPRKIQFRTKISRKQKFLNSNYVEKIKFDFYQAYNTNKIHLRVKIRKKKIFKL